MNAIATTNPVVAEVNIGNDRRHLAEVRQRRLAAVGLPIGVGDEADRRVERQHRLHPWELQRVEGQMILKHEDQVDQHRHQQVRHQHVEGVGLPVHRPMCRLPADERIESVVDAVEHRVEPGAAIHDDGRQVTSDGNAERQHEQQNHADLQPGLEGYGHRFDPENQNRSG